MKNILSALVFVLFTGAVSSAYAHHSSAPHFDSSIDISVEGTVTSLRFVNPHTYFYFDVVEDGKTNNWRCETTSATQLARWGWTKNTLTPGQKITVNGHPARREENVCSMSSIILADGTEIGRNSDLNETNPSLAAAPTEQTPDSTIAAADRPEYLANGQPNIEGAWITKSFGRGAQGIKPVYVATDAGKAAAQGYEMAFDDPILQCHPVNIFNGWNHDENINEIHQNADTIVMQYGFMDFVRTIHLNLDKHPANIVPSAAGHSIGKWEGDVLVVDTVGFEEGVLDHMSGTKHSTQMHAVERFQFDPERQYLVRDYRITDPLYLVGESTGQDMMAIADMPYKPYNCVELSGKNNIRPN